MKVLTDLCSLIVGDKVLQVESNQGLDGHVERVYANLVTVIKCTKAKVYFCDDVYNITFAIRKDNYNVNSGFYYGKKTSCYIANLEQLQNGKQMLT